MKMKARDIEMILKEKEGDECAKAFHQKYPNGNKNLEYSKVMQSFTDGEWKKTEGFRMIEMGH
ncbi:MAG: hypothetical protein COV70_04435 [Parcubacteria group bacterium CG11_big_fil_rev_8_21_14_0_20_39_22]|nr:MAG: hypothetical protein COV70_04435 [Parcubacteria group bacterium CG11_big_fil_rev_8_21_14_0_20_39_22]